MPTSTPTPPHPAPAAASGHGSAATRGWLLGVLGVVIFALSIPMTRLASGPAGDQLPAVFIAIGRAAGAGVLALAWLAWTRAPRPQPAQWRVLAQTAAGVVFGWPLLLGFAVLSVDATHAAVVTGVLPIATAALGALLLRQRPAWGFWASALAGAALVLAFAAHRGAAGLQGADALLLGAVLCAAYGYVQGARLSIGVHGPALAPEHVISWVLVLSLPLTLPLALWHWPVAPVRASAWAALAYLALFSMWLGFFAWYRALALGGTLRVSQIQLLQPFLSILLAVPLLGETLELATLGFAAAVLLTVLLARRLATPAPPALPLHDAAAPPAAAAPSSNLPCRPEPS